MTRPECLPPDQPGHGGHAQGPLVSLPPLHSQAGRHRVPMERTCLQQSPLKRMPLPSRVLRQGGPIYEGCGSDRHW